MLILGVHKSILYGCAQYFKRNYLSLIPPSPEYSVYQLRSVEQKALITDLTQFTPEFWVLGRGLRYILVPRCLEKTEECPECAGSSIGSEPLCLA
jgi:hypothetical protein